MSNTISPLRRLANALATTIDQHELYSGAALASIFDVLDQFLNDFECSWTPMQQQQHVEKCAQEIRFRLEKAAKLAVSVDVIKEAIERAFNEITRSLESLSMPGD